jgi:hypothetical protein
VAHPTATQEFVLVHEIPHSRGSPPIAAVGATSIVVPAHWRSGLVTMRLNAVVSCSEEPNCSFRILADGIEANPAGDNSFWMQGPSATWPIALDRWTMLIPGAHTVQVQWDVNASSCGCAGNSILTIKNWVLTIDESRSR